MRTQSFACNTDPCGMRWGNWSTCSANCSRGIQKAKTECQANKGDPWVECSSIVDYSLFDFEWIRGCNNWNKSTCPR